MSGGAGERWVKVGSLRSVVVVEDVTEVVGQSLSFFWRAKLSFEGQDQKVKASGWHVVKLALAGELEV